MDAPTPPPLLSVTDLAVNYGAIRAVNGVSFAVPAGAIVTLIGGNGAGKSTTLRTLSGLLRPAAGRVTFRGEEITRLAPHQIVARGLGHVPEGRMVFPGLTVDENLAMGAYLQRDRATIAATRDYVFGIFPRLKERLRQTAGTLSGGEQQMLAIGRALIAQPQLILLDEPSLGLSPKLVEDIFTIIARINAERGTSMLLVEQNATVALAVAHQGYIMENGKIVIDGTAERLANDPDVREFYLGMGGGGEAKSFKDIKHYKRRKRWLS